MNFTVYEFYWVGQKLRLGFLYNVMGKPEQTFWLTQYIAFSYKKSNSGCVTPQTAVGQVWKAGVVTGLFQVRATGGWEQDNSSEDGENWSDCEDILTGETRGFTYTVTFISNITLQADSQPGTTFTENHCMEFRFYENMACCFHICVFPFTVSTVLCKFIESHVHV